VSVDEVIPGLLEIIGAEGPMPCHRAYRIYARACGIHRVGRQIRSIFNRAIAKALRQRLIEQRNEHQTRDQINQIVRKAGTSPVFLRTRGDRTFHEIPPAEVAALMNCFLQQEAHIQEDRLFHLVLDQYQIGRTTSAVRSKLVQIKNERARPEADLSITK
jgi:hypothetical protein